MILRAVFLILMMSLIAWDGRAQLANLYPNDLGIENDPKVLFTEFFDGPLDLIFDRYNEVVNTAGMSLDEDVPTGSMGPYSLRMTSTPGVNTGGHLYKSFDSVFDGSVYLRYYVKYPSESKGYFHHESVRMGGYNPPLPWPHPRAGTCGLGDNRLSVTFEPVWQDTDPPGMDTYLYWGDMRSWNDGSSCFGNVMITEGVTEFGEPPATGTYPTVVFDEWMCVELMVKLNDPVTEYNGELAIWVDGEQVGHWGPGFPNGHWLRDKWFNNPADPPFEGFRWRTDPNLNINWLWILFFHSNPNAPASYLKYDHIVMANEYIGPIYNPSTGVEDNNPDVSMEAVVFPNPSGSSFNIKIVNADNHNYEGKITVLNLLGKELHSNPFTNEQPNIKVDLSEFPDGIYFLKIDCGDRLLNRKIIKTSGS